MLTVHVCETENRVIIPKSEFEKLVKMKSGKHEQVSVKRVDRLQFSGILEWGEDALAYQRRVRGEWR